MMKVLVILTVCFVSSWGKPSDPSSKVYIQVAREAIPKCQHVEGFDQRAFNDISTLDILPEDNKIYNQWMECFWKQLGIIDNNGEVVDDKMRELFRYFVREKYGGSSAGEVANDAVTHCKDIPKGDSVGQTVIKVKNCHIKYVESQLVNLKHKTYEAAGKEAYSKCAQIEGFTGTMFYEIAAADNITEDNEIYNNWMECFWKELGVIDENGNVLDSKIRALLPLFIKEKYGLQYPHKLAQDSIDHCKDTPKGDCVGKTVIKYKNCLSQYAKNQLKNITTKV